MQRRFRRPTEVSEVCAAICHVEAAGLATLWMAIAADVGASVAVILNGIRLRRMET